jgi:hypothetical protein
MKEIVIDVLCATFNSAHWLHIVDYEDEIAEGDGHEELLQHSDHVADVPEITDTGKPDFCTGFVEGVMQP